MNIRSIECILPLTLFHFIFLGLTLMQNYYQKREISEKWSDILCFRLPLCIAVTFTLIPKCPSYSHAETQACNCWDSWQHKLFLFKRGKNSQPYTLNSGLQMAVNTRFVQHLGYSSSCFSSQQECYEDPPITMMFASMLLKEHQQLLWTERKQISITPSNVLKLYNMYYRSCGPLSTLAPQESLYSLSSRT